MARHQLVLLVAALALGEHPQHRSLDVRVLAGFSLEKIFVLSFASLIAAEPFYVIVDIINNHS